MLWARLLDFLRPGLDEAPAATPTHPDFIFDNAKAPRVAILLSHERSGSHLLKHLLQSTGRIHATNEICNLSATPESDPESFFGVRREVIDQQPDIDLPYPENTKELTLRFFEQIRHVTTRDVILLDLKYGHAQNFESFQTWVMNPCNVFIDTLQSHDVKLIHLYRRNLFAAVASNYFANAVRQWSSDSGPLIGPKVVIERNYFLIQLLRLATATATWRHRLKLPNVASISYEALTESPSATASSAINLARFLGVEDQYWSPYAPDKKMSPPIQAYVANFPELSDLWEIYSDIEHFEALVRSARAL
jgi:LPS sulfotransferase NodH